MAKLKSLIKRTEVVQAKSDRRKCKNSKKPIPKGQSLIIVHEGMYEKFPYCREIALEMIAAARNELDELEAELL